MPYSNVSAAVTFFRQELFTERYYTIASQATVDGTGKYCVQICVRLDLHFPSKTTAAKNVRSVFCRK